MRLPTLLVAVAAAALALPAPSRAQAAPTAADSAAIRAAALDYVEGWYAGDPARMERALHPNLAKRIVGRDTTGAHWLSEMGATQLVQGVRRGGGRQTPEAERQRDVQILDVFGNAASVRATMSGWIDYMHLAKWNGRWVIVNVLWEMKPESGGRD